MNKQQSTSFFKRLRMGQYPLVKTFWLYGIVGIAILGLVLNILIKLPYNGFFALLGLLFVAFMVFYYVNILLGVWRSATNYVGAPIWRILAKIWVCLGWLSLCACSLFFCSAILHIK